MLLQTLNDAGVDTPVRLHGIPQEFLDHAKRGVILERIGLTAQALARGIVEDVTALDAGESLLPGGVTRLCLDGGMDFDVDARPRQLPRPRATAPPTSTGPAARRCPRQVADAVAVDADLRHLQPGHGRPRPSDGPRRSCSAPGPRWPTCSAATPAAWSSAGR